MSENSAVLRALGWRDPVADAFAAAGVDGQPGRVARTDRGRARIVTADQVVVRAVTGEPVTTGDWVVVSPQRIEAVLPRWSLLRRRGPDGSGEQLLAANVDLVGVVIAMDRPVNARRLERLVTLAWDAGAVPLVVLTKADLAGDRDATLAAVRRSAPGCDMLVTSGHTGAGIAPLSGALAGGNTLVLLGESGAGKSTLVNRLAGADLQATGPLRRPAGKGRHTTTARELVVLPGGGVLLDTPGLRAVGLPEGAGDALDRTFADVAELAATCRFRDCRHDREPGCAVLAAVDDSRLPAARLDAYRKLDREIAFEERRGDERARRARERAFGRQARAVMAFKRQRP